MPRPKKQAGDDKRRVHMLVDPADYEEWTRVAKLDGYEQITPWIRSIVRRYIEHKAKKKKEKEDPSP